jgi:hypothetical protein
VNPFETAGQALTLISQVVRTHPARICLPVSAGSPDGWPDRRHARTRGQFGGSSDVGHSVPALLRIPFRGMQNRGSAGVRTAAACLGFVEDVTIDPALTRVVTADPFEHAAELLAAVTRWAGDPTPQICTACAVCSTR